MTLELAVLIAGLIASRAVVASIIYLGSQARQGTRVNSAAARYAISQFALKFSIFNAEHADRLTNVTTETNLVEGKLTYQFWNHMTVF